MIVEKEEAVRVLRLGFELRCYGSGWWITEPHIPYKRSQRFEVSEDIVNQLEKDGVIWTKPLTRSIVGGLVQ